MGTEQLLLGDSIGSYSLSEDKTSQFYLMIDSTLMEVTASVELDLMGPIWLLNGWPDETKPEITTEAVRNRNIMEMSRALKELSLAGAPILPNDPAIGEFRDIMGLSRPANAGELDAYVRALTAIEEGEGNQSGGSSEGGNQE